MLNVTNKNLIIIIRTLRSLLCRFITADPIHAALHVIHTEKVVAVFLYCNVVISNDCIFWCSIQFIFYFIKTLKIHKQTQFNAECTQWSMEQK